MNRLVYLHMKATPEFWDQRWEKEEKNPDVDPMFVRITRRHLPPGSRILEGGCGRADKVKALVSAGFQALGIDFAERTVAQARRVHPGLDLRKGDVRALELPDDSMDGYWSIGVIEHFWSGYDGILAECARVIRPGGFLFLSAPWLSPYRKLKVLRNQYPKIQFDAEPDDFYQYALSRMEVTHKLKHFGFDVRSWSGVACEISMLEDMTKLRHTIQWLFLSKGNLIKRVLRRGIVDILNGYCGHSFIAVAQRRASS